MVAENALEQVYRTMTACKAHRRRQHLPQARLGTCNPTDCPLHAGCAVLAAFTGQAAEGHSDTAPRKPEEVHR